MIMDWTTGRLGGVAWTAVATAALAVGATPAGGQDALGSGNALDGNLGRSTGGINRAAPVTDFRARNLVVTGDVPGGRGFRDTVGYRAAGDFLGTTGSDDLFLFRSTSALSAPNFIRYGNTAEQLRFGHDMAVLEYRRESSPTGSAEATRTEPFRRTGLLADRIRLDWLAQATNSNEVIRESVTPRIVGVQLSPDGEPEYVIDASSLLGVTQTPVDQLAGEGLSLFDQLRVRQDAEEGREAPEPGARFRLDFEAMPPELLEAPAIAESADPEEDPRRLPIGRSEDYQRIVERIAKRYFEATGVTWSAEPTLLKDLQAEFERLQDELGIAPLEPVDPDLLPPGETDEGDEGEGDEASPGERTAPESLFPRAGERPDEQATEDEPTPRPLADFGLVLRHGERIERLTVQDQSRFNELLRMAEQSLREGEYFWAERRFIRSLRFVPGHPLATAGLGHAQLGAGLYASAALTLRGLLTLQPEMIDARYDESLMPNRVRLDRVVEDLRERIGQSQDDAAHGLLLAYVGHQLEDETLVREGLDAMIREDPGDRLLELLRSVWLPE